MARILSDARALHIPIGRLPTSSSRFVAHSKLASIVLASFSFTGFCSSATISLTSSRRARENEVSRFVAVLRNQPAAGILTLAVGRDPSPPLPRQDMCSAPAHVRFTPKSGQKRHSKSSAVGKIKIRDMIFDRIAAWPFSYAANGDRAPLPRRRKIGRGPTRSSARDGHHHRKKTTPLSRHFSDSGRSKPVPWRSFRRLDHECRTP